jgi:cytoskeletal protein CcmA (bactofilin family)
MSTAQILLAFAGLCLGLLFLPWLPALRTLARQPLLHRPSSLNDDPPARMAAFREQVSEQFGTLLRLAREGGALRGANENGRPFIVLGFNNHLSEQLPPSVRRLRTLVLAAGHLDIPGELICDREVFAEGRINIAHNAILKAALSCRDIALGPRARITRWARCDRRLDVAEGGYLKGWASAGVEMTLARRARFTHLEAPSILFGRPQAQVPAADPQQRFETPAAVAGQPCQGRHLSIPAGHIVKADLMVSGRLEIGDGCRIIGNLRAGRSLHIGNQVSIEGAVYCDGPITTGKHCSIAGPLLSRGQVSLGMANCIGSQDQPSSLVAAQLQIGEGSRAHGSVVAYQGGEVVDERSLNS